MHRTTVRGNDAAIRDASTPPLVLQDVERAQQPDGTEHLAFSTDAGTMVGRLHWAGGDTAVLWVFGAGGGLNGPAGGVYPRLAGQLRHRGVTSLELGYRRPAALENCVADVLLGIDWLKRQGKSRVALVGHSFGGAVVITAGVAAGDTVVGVAALSSQTSGTQAVGALSPRKLLLVHGTADQVIPDACSRDLYARAEEPKQLILYPGCRHGLDECRDQLDRDLSDWLQSVLLFPTGRSASARDAP